VLARRYRAANVRPDAARVRAIATALRFFNRSCRFRAIFSCCAAARRWISATCSSVTLQAICSARVCRRTSSE